MLIFIGTLLAGALAEKLMYAELFKQIYHTDKDNNIVLHKKGIN